tara:strand:+ start:4770 stop:5576 length:807 start_codon:yes stop_codon:yes gene_type:complete
MANNVEPLFDIGANLLDRQLFKNFNEIVSKCKTNNIKKIIITSSHIDDTYKAKELIDREPDLLFTTVGFHPHNAKDYKDEYYERMVELCNLDYVKAIGECGLDYKRNYSNKNDQLYCFQKHLELATEINLPMFLHERDAHFDFSKILKEYIHQVEDVVVHCFTGDKTTLEDYLDMGCYIGLTGWITDPNRGHHLHDIIKYIPSNKLMIETDSPYLMPYSYNIDRNKYNEPSNLVYVLDAVSCILKKDKRLLANELYNNTCKFFNIDHG